MAASICVPPTYLRAGMQQVLNECVLEKVHPGTAHLLHGLLVVSEVLQLPLGPFCELLEDLLPPGGGLGRRDGQREHLHGGGQACGPVGASGLGSRPGLSALFFTSPFFLESYHLCNMSREPSLPSFTLMGKLMSPRSA